ncbi:MAG TPA: NAD(P)/FAD-dependent oxidoreductase [Deltaproteobacteria bacterium]|jgi:prolycopene isomerase|nr:NAD(P)/FAD-dependent oxidoreductase [Deltaproteobacteria bacterium]HOI08164.1 NAD(P)/FAD-dependent oxidoreductase [Deltaproteobacteria bacterium]
MNDYDVVVIGAGNGGLTSALALAKKGCRVLLLERHNVPGGCATSFVRGRFEFEVALHQLSGLGTQDSPGPLRSLLQRLGVLEKVEFVQMDNLFRMVLPGRLDILLKADREEITRALKDRFPAESAGIDRFFDLLYTFCTQLIFGVYGRDPELSRAKYPEFFTYAVKDCRTVMDMFFSDPILKMVVGSYWSYLGLPPDRLPFLDYAIMLFSYIELKPFHIKGGSQALSCALLDSFLEAGGHARLSCGASKILVSDGRVQGVLTEDGREIRTGHVVSNASTLTTYLDMMDRDSLPEGAMRSFSSRTVGTSAFTLYIGFDREPQDMGITDATTFIYLSDDYSRMHSLGRTLERPEWALFSCYDAADPEFSPAGCSQAALLTLQYADPWLSLPADCYAERKYAYAEHLLDMMDLVYPGCRGRIEELEVSTPLTHMRFLGHPGGAIYGFDQYAKDTNLFISPVSPIQGLFFAGAWAGAGGFQPTLVSGQAAARSVLKSLNR